MSIQKTATGYKVRWLAGGHHRSRTFTLKKDAEAWELDIRRRAQLGPLAQDVLISRITLTEFAVDWFRDYAAVNLKPSTYRRYAEIWSTHLNKRVGGYRLTEITPAVVQDLAAQLSRTKLSPASQRKTLLLLQGILKRAVVRGLLSANPVQLVDKPRTPVQARREPLPPETIERIRANLGQRDATLVSVLAYAGLRPGEAITAKWGDIQGGKLHVLASKTEKERWVRLLAPLAQDLAEWKLASGRPEDGSLIFPRLQERSRKRSTEAWTPNDYANFRFRIYQPAARDAGVTGDLRPYRLRGSFASLLLWEGRSLPYVAEQCGHSVATLAKHYAGTLEALEDAPRVSADDAIRAARAKLACPVVAPTRQTG